MAARKQSEPLIELPVSTADGEFVAGYSDKGLVTLDFPSQRKPAPAGDIPTNIRKWHRATTIALKRALAGRSPKVLPPLDLSRGTIFQQRIWNALLKIPLGQTRSYSEIAKSIRNPRAIRATGRACGANHIPVFIPCHRVLARDNHIGGYSGGLKWKKLLLWREGSRNWWPREEPR